MTHMPPPPPNVQYAPQYPQQPSANAWSIASLICGILGCLVITPFVAIITGIIGLATSKPPRGGKGMAIAGIILGLLWVGAFTAGAVGFGYIATHITALAPMVAKPMAIQYINRLAAGDTAGAEKVAGGLSQEDREGLVAQLKPLGLCRDVQINNSNYDSVNGVIHFTFSGTAVFEHGSKSIDVSAKTQGSAFTLDRFELK